MDIEVLGRDKNDGLGCFVAAVVVWLFSFLFCLAALAGLGYVAYHFLMKVW